MTETVSPKKPVWEAEKEFPELCETLRTGLQEVTDPELHLSVIQLGLIRNVKVEPDNVLIRMILTTPFCPYGPAMLEQVRVKAEELLKRPTHMEFAMEPWDFSMMDEELGREWGIF
jgi:metal-sulfur cluster biosynthetic enzyme